MAYLRVAQTRKNRLLEVAAGERTAALYIRGVAEFIVFTAAPYFAQRSSMEILNHLCFVDFANGVESSLRLDTALADDGALAAAAASNMTIEAHASALRSVVDTTYRILERRVFALPKIFLFPAVVARHPRMAAIALPALLAVDALKGKVVARLSTKVEELRREKKRLLSVRT